MRIETGDGWELRLGDCLDPETGLASLDAVDHVITDPPYEAEAHTKQRRVKGGGVVEVEPLSFETITATRGHVAAALRPNRWCVVFCQAEAVKAWADDLESAGLNYRRACVWIKRDGMPQYSGDRPGMGYESIVCCHATDRSKWNGGGKHGVYDFLRNQYGGQRQHHHPTEKPLLLMEALVSDFTDLGELVCDPFAGSGTTGVACIRLGRRFIGWEKDPKFFEVAMKRLRSARRQYTIFEASDPGSQEKLF